jgi:glutamate-1-semialdehyde 2,1-aminomutase
MASPDRPITRSQAAFAKARQLMPGGVSSPVRAFNAVGGTPSFIHKAAGATVTDLDGRTFIDFVASYGPMIVGHANERVVAALSKAIGRGTSYGAPTEAETELAARIIAAMPSVQMIRFVNSGTEAVMSAVRLARAATGRDLIIKCAGCYHGHADPFLVEAGSGAATHGVPTSPGVPKSAAASTIVVPFNDLEAAKTAFDKHHNSIACFVVEPVAGNMGLVPPDDGYLQGLRTLCDKHESLLIFDEVMTGFRVAWGGAQVRYRVKPDLTCLGKIIGGGLPVGAYGGRKDLMKQISPSGPVYQAGTLSGNPLAMAGGIATLEILSEPNAYKQLEDRSAALANGLTTAAAKAGVPLIVNRVGSMLSPFFIRKDGQTVRNFTDATACDTNRFAAFFHSMLDRGIYLPPSQFETWFVSLAHSASQIDRTITAAEEAMIAAAKVR